MLEGLQTVALLGCLLCGTSCSGLPPGRSSCHSPFKNLARWFSVMVPKDTPGCLDGAGVHAAQHLAPHVHILIPGNLQAAAAYAMLVICVAAQQGGPGYICVWQPGLHVHLLRAQVLAPADAAVCFLLPAYCRLRPTLHLPTTQSASGGGLIIPAGVHDSSASLPSSCNELRLPCQRIKLFHSALPRAVVSADMMGSGRTCPAQASCCTAGMNDSRFGTCPALTGSGALQA